MPFTVYVTDAFNMDDELTLVDIATTFKEAYTVYAETIPEVGNTTTTGVHVYFNGSEITDAMERNHLRITGDEPGTHYSYFSLDDHGNIERVPQFIGEAA